MVITPKPKIRVAPKSLLTLKIIEDAQSGINTKGNLTDKPYKIGDSGGLFLLVTPAGGKWWRFKYRFGCKEKLLSLGTYPEVGLDDARAKRDAFRALLKNDIDLSAKGTEEREVRRAEEARNVAATRFALENDGALSIRLGNKRFLKLTPTETAELRYFLHATREVIPKETPCP